MKTYLKFIKQSNKFFKNVIISKKLYTSILFFGILPFQISEQ